MGPGRAAAWTVDRNLIAKLVERGEIKALRVPGSERLRIPAWALRAWQEGRVA
jgi:hypothetical protein